MNNKLSSVIRKNLLLVISIYVMTFGVSLFLRSSMGSSAISSVPYVWSEAGTSAAAHFGFSAPALTVGGYTVIMNTIFVVLQILILRRKYQLVQLGQLVIGVVFSALLDVNMLLTEPLKAGSGIGGFAYGLILVFIAGAIMGFGVACEVRCKSVMMPGEGIQVAIAQASGADFGKVKIFVDCSLVLVAVISSFVFFGTWRWDIIGIGTLISMVYIGIMVRFFSHHLAWFDNLLEPKPKEEVFAEEAETEQVSLADYPLVITISRQKGSGGREIGEKLADHLSLNLYDNDILLRTAKDLDLAPAEVANREQNLSTPSLLTKLITDDYIPRDTVLSTDDRLYVSQSRYIREAAAKEPCVIIGRCADQVLAGRPNVLRLFVLSNADFAANRVLKIPENKNMTRAEALAKIDEVNTARANHYLRYTGKRWGDAANYDLVLNTSTIGIDHAVELVCSLVLNRDQQ